VTAFSAAFSGANAALTEAGMLAARASCCVVDVVRVATLAGTSGLSRPGNLNVTVDGTSGKSGGSMGLTQIQVK
jgi:hypothetical protein